MPDRSRPTPGGPDGSFAAESARSVGPFGAAFGGGGRAGRGRPRVPIEVALLHQCGYKFSGDRARERLGYEPPISAEEGLRRTLTWLKLIGYPAGDAKA